MAKPPNAPRFGTAVEGEARFPRPVLEAEFDHLMAHTNGTRIFGLRRTGKSTEGRALCDRLHRADPQALVIYIDAQGMESEASLLVDLLKALPARAKGWHTRFFELLTDDQGISHLAREALKKLTGASADIQAYFGPIIQLLERALQPDDKVTLVIDEFPWLCRSILEHDPESGRARVDVLLASLRRLRDRHVRMVLMGSIGMTALLREHRVYTEHLNDLQLLEIPPLAPEEAKAFLAWLVAGHGIQGWTEAHTQGCLDECGVFYPSVLHIAFLQLTVGGRAAALANIPDIFADKVRPDFDATLYAQFDRRLAHYRGLPEPLPSLTRALLDRVLNAPGQTATLSELRGVLPTGAEDTDLRDALSILREDGFLSLRVPRGQPEQWRAASPLVPSWWQQGHGGFRP